MSDLRIIEVLMQDEDQGMLEMQSRVFTPNCEYLYIRTVLNNREFYRLDYKAVCELRNKLNEYIEKMDAKYASDDLFIIGRNVNKVE